MQIQYTKNLTLRADTLRPSGRGKDVYKTWTLGPWTTPVKPVHGPLHGPGPWTTPVDHPLFFYEQRNLQTKERSGPRTHLENLSGSP